jgi:hypothetical protein
MNFAQVRSFDNYISANIMQGKLEAEGIYCYLADDNTSTIFPVLSNPIGGIKLMVAETDVTKVESILAEFDSAYKQTLTCPQCGSQNVEYISKSNTTNWLSAIFFWLLGNYAIAAEQTYHCYNCGFEFEELPDKPLETGSE